MVPEKFECVVRAVVRSSLDDCNTLLPEDRRYADFAAQRMAKDSVADHIAATLRANGFLPADDSLGSTAANFRAVSFALAAMRKRLLDKVEHAGTDWERRRDIVESLTRHLFTDLERSGWRLVRTHLPAAVHNTTKHTP
jgi:hypothetical protein